MSKLHRIPLILKSRISRKIKNRRRSYLHVENVLGIKYSAWDLGTETYIKAKAKELAGIHKSGLRFFSNDSRQIIKQRYEGEIIEKVPGIIEAAERIVNHDIDILNTVSDVGNDLNWHKDYESGITWPLEYYTGVDIFRRGLGADVKVPWELSRMHHLVKLGMAFSLTEERKYASEFKKQVVDWIFSNPPLYGINWTCAMEAAIRATNLLYALSLFRGASELDEKFYENTVATLLNHGRYIYSNLENTGPSPNNHYLADLVGLAFLGAFFLDNEEPKKWISFAQKEIEREVGRQVNSDGTYYEGSIPYHGFVTQMLLAYSILIKKMHKESNLEVLKGDFKISELSEAFVNKLSKMVEFVVAYIKPDGSAPQIGDNDSGKFLCFAVGKSNRKNDHRQLLAIAGQLFEQQDWKYWAGKSYEDAIWLLEGSYTESRKKNYTLPSACFKDMGIYIMRHNDNHFLIKASQNGTCGIGTHTHNDMLSFELSIGNKNIIVDPGTYSYNRDPKIRNIFRSTAYHNTVKIDNEEINRFDDLNMFALADEAKPKVLSWEVTNEKDIFSGEHNGYSRLENEVIHRRKIDFDKQSISWTITDEFFGSGGHLLEWNFHFGDRCEVSLEEYGLNVWCAGMQVLKISVNRQLPIAITRYHYSENYGGMKESSKATINTNAELPFKTIFILQRVGSK